jgi:hypothetical protein
MLGCARRPSESRKVMRTARARANSPQRSRNPAAQHSAGCSAATATRAFDKGNSERFGHFRGCGQGAVVSSPGRVAQIICSERNRPGQQETGGVKKNSHHADQLLVHIPGLALGVVAYKTKRVGTRWLALPPANWCGTCHSEGQAGKPSSANFEGSPPQPPECAGRGIGRFQGPSIGCRKSCPEPRIPGQALRTSPSSQRT